MHECEYVRARVCGVIAGVCEEGAGDGNLSFAQGRQALSHRNGFQRGCVCLSVLFITLSENTACHAQRMFTKPSEWQKC